jgi:hypothetical protein
MKRITIVLKIEGFKDNPTFVSEIADDAKVKGLIMEIEEKEVFAKIVARVKKTGKIIEVKDYGEKYNPRYWDETQGYMSDELELRRES